MTSIDLKLDGDGCWPDLSDLPTTGGEIEGVALLPDGEVSDGLTGEKKIVPILTLRVKLPGGTVVLAQVKVEMLEAVLAGVRGRLQYLAALKARGGVDS